MVKFLDLQKVTAQYAQEIHEAVDRVVDSGWYLQGSENEHFEKEYAAFIGTRYAIGCGNGLDALLWIFRAYIEMGVMQPGDEVIVPANTYIASILALTDNGLTPVLVEPSPLTCQIDEEAIEAAITPRTKGLLIVHLYGRLAYTPKIGELCSKYHLKLVEDNAQAHGCMCNGRRTGSLGDAAGHSFYPGKVLGAFGDAGAVTTNDETLARVVRSLANYGSQRKYVFKYRGRNSRLDEIQAAVLSVKLHHLEHDIEARRVVAAQYYDRIHNPLIALPPRAPKDEHVYHLFPVLCPQRDRLQEYLSGKEIQTIIHYPIPPHKQECYRQWNSLSLPVTERLAAEELSIPIGPVMSQDEVDAVVESLNGFK